MNKKLLLGLASLMLALSLALTGCGNKEVKNEAKEEKKQEEKKTEEKKEEKTEGKMTFKNYDREVVIEKTPTKVLTFGPNATELFCALGLNDKVIGSTYNNHGREPQEQYKEAYQSIKELNHSSATREAVLTSGADFIYGVDWDFGEGGIEIAELEKAGINVYLNKASKLEEQYQEIMDLGKIFGVEEKAEAFVKEQKAKIEEINSKVKAAEPVKVLVYDSGNDGVFTCSGSNFATRLIELAGGKNIFDDLTEKNWLTVSHEEILKRNPDYVVVMDYDVPDLETKLRDIKANPALSQLDAVKNEKFVTITLESVFPGDRMAYSVEKLAKGLHPDLFK